MEYVEYPSVESGFSRKITFSRIKWLKKSRFEHLLSKNTSIYPFLNDTIELSLNRKQDSRIFIGKIIPKCPQMIDARLNMTEPLSHLNLELVGNVKKQNDKWILIVTFRGCVYEIEDDFLVLYINDCESFCWKSNMDDDSGLSSSSSTFKFNNKDVPQYAFKAGVDKLEHKFIYIGRTMKNQTKRPKYYSNGWFYMDDERESHQQLFGRINRSYKLLFAPLKDLEIGHDQFETLCLKASPASLKLLCRSVIRSHLNYSQKSLRATHEILPESVVSFLKYPSSLKVGEFMLNDEKLVHENNDEYELFIDKKTRSLICNKKQNGKTIQIKVLARNVDTISLNRFHAVFYNDENKRAQTHHSIYDSDLGFTFAIDWEKLSSIAQ